MSPSDNRFLADALQDLKEAVVHKIAKRFISDRISFGEVVSLLRTRSSVDTMRHLRRTYLLTYLWKKARRFARR